MLNTIFACGLMGLSYLTRTNLRVITLLPKMIRAFRLVLLYTPIVLLLLGMFGVFNVFKSVAGSGELAVINSLNSGVVLTVDSRTSIYVDALNNLNDNNSWF